MQRIIGLDVGDVRIGVAVSDDLLLTAQPLETYTRIGYGPDVRHITDIARHYGTDALLLGLPLRMDGTEGEQAQKVRAFAEQLLQAGLTVRYQDERLTTVAAERAMLSGDLHRDARKARVDKVAACLILQTYLDANHGSLR